MLQLCQSFAEGDPQEEGTKHGTVSGGERRGRDVGRAGVTVTAMELSAVSRLKSQLNHRTTDLKVHLVPNPLPQAGHQVTKCCPTCP